MRFKPEDRVVANDAFGNYRNEVGTVVGFKTSLFGKLLVQVQLDSNNEFGIGPSVFYEKELKPWTPEPS